MKRNKINEQIDSFKNKEEKGLFTFYLQTQLPHQALARMQHNKDNTHIIERDPNPLLDSKRITPRKKLQQKKKPIRNLTKQLNQNDSIDLIGKKIIKKKILTQGQGSTQQIIKIRQLFNFKRKSNQKLIEECIQSNKKIQSSKSIKLQRQISNIQPNQNYQRNTNVSSHLVYPLEQGKQRYYFPTRSPKRHQSLQKDYQAYQNLLLPEIEIQSRTSLEKTIHALKCQTIIHPEKFKSIVYPSSKKLRNPYIKNHCLLIRNDPIDEEKISIELKPKYHASSDLGSFINCSGISQKINEKINKATDYQDTSYRLTRFIPSKNHHLFNTLERSLMSSLQKVEEEEDFEKDLQTILKDNSSNLLKKRSHHINLHGNVSEFRVKRSLVAIQKPSKVNDIRKNESEMVTRKDNKVKYAKMPNAQCGKNQADNSLKQVKHNFLKILTKIKDRYQSI